MATAIRTLQPAENETLAELERKANKPSNFFRAMAHRPETLKAFVPLYASIMGRGTVDRRLKELAYLASSYANECPYCVYAHTLTAPKAGISPDELIALRTEQDHGFSEQEKAVIHFARELTRTADLDQTRDVLLQHFSDEQMVELTLVVAMANFTNRFNNALGVRPEE